jgi:hypothetical protein
VPAYVEGGGSFQYIAKETYPDKSIDTFQTIAGNSLKRI